MGRILRMGVLFAARPDRRRRVAHRVLNAAGNFNTVTAALRRHMHNRDRRRRRRRHGTRPRHRNALHLLAGPQTLGGRRHVAEGALYLALIDQPQDAPPPVPLIENDDAFHPHGLSLFADAMGRKTLAVVNHSGAGDEVMLFDVNDDRRHDAQRDAHAPPDRQRPADAFAERRHARQSRILLRDQRPRLANRAGQAARNLAPAATRERAVFYDGSVAKVAATGFNYANGINRNADASEIYVAEATGRALQTFRRDMTTGLLEHIHTLFLGVGPDNLDVDSEGAIWIGAHPRLLDFVAHVEDKTKLSPLSGPEGRRPPATTRNSKRSTSTWAKNSPAPQSPSTTKTAWSSAPSWTPNS